MPRTPKGPGNIPGLEPALGALRMRGALRVFYSEKYQRYIAQSWPRSNGGDTPGRKAARAQFTRVVKLIKSSIDLDMDASIKLAEKSAFLPRDLRMMAATGTLIRAVMIDGTILESGRMKTASGSDVLDTITTLQGAMVQRGPVEWQALPPALDGQVITFNSTTGLWEARTPSGGGGGGGYDPGVPPEVVQTLYDPTGGASVTLSAAPTDGNLLVAMVFNPSTDSIATGWTVQTENSGGTDYGVICTKIAGPSESATQTILNSAPGTGGIMVWEIVGQATAFYVGGLSEPENTGTNNAPTLYPCCVNVLALHACCCTTSATIDAVANIGVSDALVNSGTRHIAAGHTDLAKTPMAGVLAAFSGSTQSKSMTALITS